MAEPINGRKVANQITARLSLRKPQRESLDLLAELLDRLPLDKEPDLQHWLQLIRSQYPSMQAFERAFPSLCFYQAPVYHRPQPPFSDPGAEPDHLREAEKGFYPRRSQVCVCRHPGNGRLAASDHHR
jgi:hypothetical protein